MGLEVELETKKSKDSVFMADCLVRDEAHGRNLNHLCGKVEAWEQSLKSQRVDHTSLTADYSVLNTSMLKEFDTLGRTIDKLCRKMKSVEVELEKKRSEDSLFVADCQARDEAHVRNLDDLRLSVETLIHEQMANLEEALKAKISKCNSKVEAYHGEFVSSQIDSWHSRAFSDTQFSNQCYTVKCGPDKKLINRARAPVR